MMQMNPFYKMAEEMTVKMLSSQLLLTMNLLNEHSMIKYKLSHEYPTEMLTHSFGLASAFNEETFENFTTWFHNE